MYKIKKLWSQQSLHRQHKTCMRSTRKQVIRKIFENTIYSSISEGVRKYPRTAVHKTYMLMQRQLCFVLMHVSSQAQLQNRFEPVQTAVSPISSQPLDKMNAEYENVFHTRMRAYYRCSMTSEEQLKQSIIQFNRIAQETTKEKVYDRSQMSIAYLPLDYLHYICSCATTILCYSNLQNLFSHVYDYLERQRHSICLTQLLHFQIANQQVEPIIPEILVFLYCRKAPQLTAV